MPLYIITIQNIVRQSFKIKNIIHKNQAKKTQNNN